MTFAGTVATVTFNGPVHTGDIIYGNEGNDTIFGGAGDDFITGGAGNNSIIAGSGNDLIFGGFPWINSATGNPYDYGTLYQLIYVGDSINLLGLTPNLSQFTLSWNGAATNSITYTGTPQDVTNIQNALSSLSGIGAGGATVYVSGTGYDSVYHVVFSSSVNWINQNLTVAVSSGPGTGYVSTAPHYLSSSDPSQMPDGPYTLFLDSYDGAANDGNNIIQGGAGNSLIFGGAGNDTITGGTGNAYIDGGAATTSLAAALALVSTSSAAAPATTSSMPEQGLTRSTATLAMTLSLPVRGWGTWTARTFRPASASSGARAMIPSMPGPLFTSRPNLPICCRWETPCSAVPATTSSMATSAAISSPATAATIPSTAMGLTVPTSP